MALPAVTIEALFDSTALTGVVKTNSFDGGTSGATITTGNSGGASGNAFDAITGSPQFTASQKYGSGMAAFNPTSGADCHLDWTGVSQAGDVFCIRLYMYLVSATSNIQRILVVQGSSGIVSAVWITNTRQIRIYLGFSTSLVATLSEPVPVGQWCRVELRYTINGAGNGTAEVWLYSDAGSTTHTDYATTTTQAWPGGKPNLAEFHLSRDAGGYWFLDDVAVASSKIGTAGGWTDLTPYARHGIATRRGSGRVQSPVIRYEAGTATCVLDNTDRRFEVENTSGPYVVGGKSKVTPMRPFRLRCTWAGVTYHLFTGYVDLWDVDWVGDVYSECAVTASDAFKVLANKKRAPTMVEVDGVQVPQTFGAGEDSGDRVDRVLDSVGWSADDRLVSVGDSTLQATTLEGDALSELQMVAESEIGELYVDGRGRVVFRNRNAIHTDTRSTAVQATFGTAARTPAEAKLSSDDATFYNEAVAQRQGGEPQTAGDADSQAEFLTRTYGGGTNLMLETDGEVLNWAQWIVYLSSEPETRFDEIRIHCHADPDTLFPLVLPREIGDRIRIVRQPPGGGSPITRDAFIRGIAHEVGGGRWVTTFQLQNARNFVPFFTLSDATLGLLDNGIPMVF
jgi:hypothetical protein